MRRYAKPKQSHGTVIPADIRLRVRLRDGIKAGGCVGRVLLRDGCEGALELDHVRASGGVGMKSITCDCNLVTLCGTHHRFKTEHGRDVRPVLIAYLALFGYTPHAEGHLTGEEIA
jgi:5-methylcytosine-specific restriction endonuclease McrA